MTKTAEGGVAQPFLLQATEPLYRGYQRLVFQHPDQPELLIKVVRSDYAEAKFGPGSPFHNRHRRCRHYQVFLRELQEYLVACARSADCLPFLQEIVGLVHTDLGLGMVVRKVCGPDGKPAPSLSRLAGQGALDAARMQLLDRCLEVLQASAVVVDDLNPGNLVLGTEPSGAECWVLIDGLGSSTLIPLKALVPWANRQSKRRRIARLRAQLIAEVPQVP